MSEAKKAPTTQGSVRKSAKKMITVSTKGGDKGETGLADGQRLSKAAPVFEVIGSLDELNSWLGLVAAKFEGSFPEHQKFLYTIQDRLFVIGAQIAYSSKVQLTLEDLKILEQKSLTLQTSMADDWHTKFLLPGGTELGGYLDIARTTCRRTEREIVRYAEHEKVDGLLLKYINRLSDYLYVLRCFVNHAVAYEEQEFNR